MKRLLEIPHRMDDHACMWSGVEDLTGKQEQTDKASEAFFAGAGRNESGLCSAQRVRREKNAAIADEKAVSSRTDAGRF